MEMYGLAEQRQQVIDLAQTLSRQSLQQWQKAIEGIVALPTAIAVGAAATTLYAVGFVTRGFEVFQREAGDAQQQMRAGQRETREQREQRGDRRGQNEETRLAENIPRA